MSKKITISKLNNSYGYIISDNEDIIKDIYNILTFYVPNYRFMPSYKNGWFDGKIKLLNLDDNTFPLGLVPHIYKFCNSYKINCYFTEDIINSFSEKINTSDIMYYFNTLQFFSKNKRIYPREDQFYATTRAITAKRCVNICPTSFGKSLSITMECLWYINCGLKCLIVVPTKDLVDQFYNDIKDYATNESNQLESWYPNTQRIYAGLPKYIFDNTNICISTWQSLIKIYKNEKNFMNNFDAIILDECFHGDSLVLTPSGYVKIKDLNYGDKIVNYSEKDNQYKIDEIVEVYKNLTTSKSEKMYELFFSNEKTTLVTGNHQFLTEYGWKRADKLTFNDIIISIDDSNITLKKRIEILKPEVVYNLHIKNDHNYIVNGLVVHNCHKGQATSIQQLMLSATDVQYRTGWTGTLSNDIISELLIKGLFGPTKEIISTKELMDKEIVANLSIQILRLKYKTETSKVLVDTDYDFQTKFIENCDERTKFLLKIAGTQMKTGLIFYKHIEHGENIFNKAREMYPERNIYFIYGGHFQLNDKKYKTFEDIKQLIEEDDNAIVIANFQVASTGISIRHLYWMMFFMPVKSFISTVQSIGRILRISNKKKNALLIDIVDDFSYKKRKKITENFAVRHFAERFSIYNKNQFNYKMKTININI